MTEPQRYAPCPVCSRRAEVSYSEYLGRDVFYCWRCGVERDERRLAFRAVLRARFPGISPRLAQGLARAYAEHGGVPAVLALTDRQFLDIRNFGRGMLAEFRTFCPEPIAVRDPWREHAEMVAGFR